MNIEIRTDGVLHIDGYVNAVERDSREILTKEGRCVERVLPGVFGKALASAEEVRMLLNHRSDRQLASTKDTLVLEEDAIGLRATADITDEEVIEKARLGKLKGWSFGFRANDTAMESRANSVPRRILKDISLFEVSVIDDEHNPCYKSTSLNCEFRAEDDIELRTDEKILDEFREQWYNEYYLPRYYRFLEVRSNPYHDPENGRFTTADGGGSGWVMYSKGGKSRYQPVNGGHSDAEIDKMYEDSQNKKNNATYESDDEILVVERVSNSYFHDEDVLDAISDADGNLTLNYAKPTRNYKQNSKTNYAIYQVKSGITNAKDVHGSRWDSNDPESKVKSENIVGRTRSVGINWDKVKTVSGSTYNVKDLLKSKGFKWNSEGKNWVKRDSENRSDDMENYRFLEERFNPYHDADNGRFTTSAGGGNGWVVYSKDGKSHYQPVNGGNTEADIDEMYANERSGNMEGVLEDISDKRIGKKEVSDLPEKLTEQQIIDRVGGGDTTRGSCSSLALAYVANQNGMDVLDFRGGTSRTYFSAQENIEFIANSCKGQLFDEKGTKNTISQLHARMEEGKEYYFATGQHAAIVRMNGGKLEYLELQSGNKGEAYTYKGVIQKNGFHPLDEKILKDRFAANVNGNSYRVPVVGENGFVKDEHGRVKYETQYVQSVLIESGKLGKSKGFKDLMGYINTSEDKQKKSSWGGLK